MPLTESLYDKASLIMTPSGIKAEKLYSQKPYSGNGDFTHDRSTTATRVNALGYIESVEADAPRLDYPIIDGVVQDSPSLLLEPSKTNLVTYSEDFTQWENTGSETTDTADAAISPDGSLNATKLQEANSSFGFHRLSKTITASSNTDYALSIFAKKGTQQYVQLLLLYTGNSDTASKVFDLENGTLGETITHGTATLTDSKIEDFGNGWYRCTIIAQLSTAPNRFRINLANAATGNTKSLGMVQYTGNSSGNIYLWGAQLEEGSYPTSYIPTSGSAVTRAADVANGAGNAQVFNDSEGVLYAELKIIQGNTTSSRISISDGSADNRIMFEDHPSDYRLRAFSEGSGSVTQLLNVTDASITNQYFKIAIKWNVANSSVYINGYNKSTATGLGDMTGLNTLQFQSATGVLDFYGKIKEVVVFNEALTDEELQQLTT